MLLILRPFPAVYILSIIFERFQRVEHQTVSIPALLERKYRRDAVDISPRRINQNRIIAAIYRGPIIWNSSVPPLCIQPLGDNHIDAAFQISRVPMILRCDIEI
jgi:hypothetical protein